MWAILNVVATQIKTLHNLAGFSFSAYYLLTVTVLLLSMAGVPPFIGFFSKLFVLTLLTNNSFFLLYAQFFVILFLGLYFYIQNVRFLHSTNALGFSYAYAGNERQILVFYYVSLSVLILIIGGVLYVDDCLLFFT